MHMCVCVVFLSIYMCRLGEGGEKVCVCVCVWGGGGGGGGLS